jgi:hypothetical protein
MCRFGGPIAIHFCSKVWADGKAGRQSVPSFQNGLKLD